MDGPRVLDGVTFAAGRAIGTAVSRCVRDLWGRTDRVICARRRGSVIGQEQKLEGSRKLLAFVSAPAELINQELERDGGHCARVTD